VFRGRCARDEEFDEVHALAERLRDHLSTPTASGRIGRANRPGASSSEVQAAFQDFALELGFVDESKGLFAGYETSAVRPDYFRRIGRTGILLEVERGKTTINNMDFLDFWKCHICEHADYLYILVPRALRQNTAMKPRNEFGSVCRRLGTFFRADGTTDVPGVHGLFVFGY
jgi:hypothetical protein